MGDGYSLAWRVYDAQYWGVPQRRKRIYLVADFRSERAGEILFEQDGMSGDSEPGKAPWQRTTVDAEGSAGGSSGGRLNVIKDREGNGHGGKGLMSCANTAYTVQTNCEQSLVYESGAFYGNAGSTRPIDFNGGGYSSGQALRDSSCGDEEVNCLNPWDYQTKRIFDPNGKYCTLQANNGGGGRLDRVVYPINTMVAMRGGADDGRTTFGIGGPRDPQFTLSAAHEHGVCYENVAAFMGGQGAKARSIAYCDDGTTPTIKASPSGGNTVPDTVYCLQGNGIDRSDTAGCNGAGWRENESYTLNTIDRPAVVCYAPEGNYCGMYRKDDTSATLQTKYHYGSGGDAATVVYDCRGNGDGKTIQTLTGDHNNRVTDFSSVVVKEYDE